MIDVDYKTTVVLLNVNQEKATLNIWVSLEDSPYVEFAVDGRHGYDGIGFEAAAARALADAFEQRAEREAPRRRATGRNSRRRNEAIGDGSAGSTGQILCAEVLGRGRARMSTPRR